MRRRLGSSIVAVLLIFSIGGHWAILQSVAWVSMVVNYSQEATLTEAVSKTFDGKHPCNLCKLVRNGKSSEHKQEALKVKSKIDFWMAAKVARLPEPADSSDATVFLSSILPVRSEGPPSPPPRWA